MKIDSRIYVAGHRGLVGSAIVRRLEAEGCSRVITRTHGESDLEKGEDVEALFAEERPEYVLLAAAVVGGIHANNSYPVDFLLRNLKIQNNVIEAAWRHGVKGLLFLGSSCIYPSLAPQPLREEYLLTGPLEPTNEPYAVAKIAGIELCEAFNRQYGTRFLSVMPTNLYGPNDNYDLESSHVLAALIRKFHLAKMASLGELHAIERDEKCYGPIPPGPCANLDAVARVNGFAPPERPSRSGEQILPMDARPAVTLWGTGSPRREFLHSDDLADACAFLLGRLDDLFAANRPAGAGKSSTPPAGPSRAQGSFHLINIGCGEDLTISELARTIARIVGYDGPIEWDRSKPDGTPQKLLDVSRLRGLGWKPRITLEEGIRKVYGEYLVNLAAC
jgi:GDP-L-fucose synthase